jgi:lysophospholipase L1-like esterase
MAVAAEVLVRSTGRFTPPPVDIVSPRADLYQRFDPYGYRLWPSRTMTYQYPREHPRELTLKSNSHGFRSRREFDERDDRPRILFLGDSMVFGEGVEESERFTDLLEAWQPAWRVDNLGMTGFGPDLMLRAFEEVGVGLRPRLVVLCLYTDDFRRVAPYYAGAGFPIPRFTLQSGRLTTVAYPTPHIWERLHLTSFVQEASSRLLNRAADSNPLMRLNQAIFDRFLDRARGVNAAFALVFIPERRDTPASQMRRKWLRAFAAQKGVGYLDLTDSIHRVGPDQAYIPDNWHLNSKGHEVVADALLRFLSDHMSAQIARTP